MGSVFKPNLTNFRVYVLSKSKVWAGMLALGSIAACICGFIDGIQSGMMTE